MIAIIDAGPLYAVLDQDDRAHVASVEALHRPGLHLVVPALVIAEVTHWAGRRLGAHAEAAFLRGVGSLQVEAPIPADWARIAELVEQYADFPLGGTDASVVALAERLGTDLVITLDRRHFGAVRPRHVPALRLIPEHICGQRPLRGRVERVGERQHGAALVQELGAQVAIWRLGRRGRGARIIESRGRGGCAAPGENLSLTPEH